MRSPGVDVNLESQGMRKNRPMWPYERSIQVQQQRSAHAEDIGFYSKLQDAIGELISFNLIPDIRKRLWVLKRKQVIGGQELVKSS